INVDRLQRELRRGLVALLADQAQPLPVAERVRAGFLLGDLGVSRFPVTIEAWRSAIADARSGQSDGYFCSLPPPAGEPMRWIARYPITNAQFQEWTRAAQLPPRRHEVDTHFNRPNQPAAGVSWHLASAFCAWLSQQTGATIRLPGAAEWEAAARGHDERRYPWGNQRLRDRAATKEDHDLRGWPYPVPVGCYPAGASAVGALDMAGNVWEWTSDLWQTDEESGRRGSEGQKRVLRGGGYLSTKSQIVATARIGLPPGAGFDNGFRVLLEIDDRSSAG
ncbi:MAG: formylglycine-generating enzyme family protein, partial [Roseiflexaceae bacterium]